MGNELAVRSGPAALTFDAGQRKLIRDTFASGASDQEFAALMAVAERRSLDPFLKQVYFVKRWDAAKRCETWAVQASIDGLRSIAQRTGLYDGQDEPVFEYDAKGAIRSCTVKVWRKDWTRPSVVTAHWSEYAQAKRDGGLTSFWATKPHIMLSKCAEALALRKAFPEDTGGMYVPEEMGQEIDVTPEVEKPAPRKRAAPEVVAAAVAHVERVTAPAHASSKTVKVVPVQAKAAEQTEAPPLPPLVVPPAPVVVEPAHDAVAGEVQEPMALVDRLATRLQESNALELTAVAADIKAALERGLITTAERGLLLTVYQDRLAALMAGVK